MYRKVIKNYTPNHHKKKKNSYDNFIFLSIFWWTNETINIWSHIFGWMLFLGLTAYDLCLLNIHAPFGDKVIVALLLVCFQVTITSLYNYYINYIPYILYIYECTETDKNKKFLFLGLYDFIIDLSHVFMQERKRLLVFFVLRFIRNSA